MRHRKVKSHVRRQSGRKSGEPKAHAFWVQNWYSWTLFFASQSLRGSPNPITTKHPNPHGRSPTTQPNLPHYSRTETEIPRCPLNSREPQSIPTRTQECPQAPKYSLPGIRQPLGLPSKPKHAPKAPPPASSAPLRREKVAAHTRVRTSGKRARPLAPSLRLSRGRAPD